MVSADFFRVLGVNPAAGRFFTANDDHIGAAPVAVISAGLWNRKFAAATDVIGKSVFLRRHGFHHHRRSSGDLSACSWQGSSPKIMACTRSRWPVDRPRIPRSLCRPGNEGHRQAETRRNHRAGSRGHGIHREPARRSLSERGQGFGHHGDVAEGKHDRRNQTFSFCAARGGGFRVVDCVRQRRKSGFRPFHGPRPRVRHSFRAGRERPTVSCANSSPKARFLRWPVARSGCYSRRGPCREFSVWFRRRRPARKTCGSMAVCFSSPCNCCSREFSFGLAPALKASQPELQNTLKEGGRGSSGLRHRAQGIFVVTEMALAVVLLIGAGLCSSLARLWSVNPGFDPQNVLIFYVALPPAMDNASAPSVRASLVPIARESRRAAWRSVRLTVARLAAHVGRLRRSLLDPRSPQTAR